MSSKDVSTTPGEVSTSGSQYIGRVKWFNNKAGFGFVTALDGDKKDEDVFVHHSAIHVSNEQYKYLTVNNNAKHKRVNNTMDDGKKQWGFE